jgi:tRNA-specific 2-thiouridylase
LYVLEIDEEQNRVVVGGRDDLERDTFFVDELSWVSPSVLKTGLVAGTEFECVAQLRHRHVGSPVRVKIESGEKVKVTFLSDWSIVPPGQACVFYDRETNTEVLGGGKIMRSVAQAPL